MGQAMCPACRGSSTVVTTRIEAVDAANHLIPPHRDPERNVTLRGLLVDLWDGDHAHIRKCGDCQFGYAEPFRSGTADIYNVIGNGAQHYPGDRYEFGRTLARLFHPGDQVGLGPGC
jgi:hypothetical protein